MQKVVLVLPKSGYRNDDFVAAAHKLGLEVVAASDVCHQLADIWDEAPVALRFRDALTAAGELAAAVRDREPVAVVGVDDLTALVAALTVLKDRGEVAREAEVMLVFTGAGLKYAPPPLPPPTHLEGTEEEILARVQRAVHA